MTHNNKRGSALKEAQLALFTGCIYGGTHTLSGHPLDTIKSKMQIQKEFASSSSFTVARSIWKTDGLVGFFRGCVPPLWGSMIYRGVMMSAYEFGYTWFLSNYDENSFFMRETAIGLRPFVPLSSIFAALTRGVIESPIEYAKVMGQTGQKWELRDIYRGFGFQVFRTTALLIPIFSSLDIFRRKTKVLDTFLGSFLVTAGASGVAYFICWPLETMKNLAQSGTPFPGAKFSDRIKYLGGYSGVYRGIWPGTLCGALRNGCAMLAMVQAQAWATKLGLRTME